MKIKVLFLGELTAAPNASVYQTELYSKYFTKQISKFKETKLIYHIDGRLIKMACLTGLIIRQQVLY